ncbi:bifunctional 23S rRNA (guanine(2069)-N(7))-methyltransferase RlmK/23S rRNA (guanine(2445)-N(2))-methyltransferase RlmL [Algicola sagamiensis]|uniref:bifunctional 23S rRNA (guanine(2069)-N(7))-methyltransferase RlmK/23S rRNA (guanine(2445)-N(2))-methyltransferase RlmL n=1 Tax=Algicola sagamiensis TaxID=163869 RepID=UPI00037CFE73|nr:bifunctional 23S rRNA (guanine(2069)-N(7))-methyltransferase RlmK/23S rRNA (guanine(2445)-N(2))-methyltransferase RlmL [Algicola sagamiensis]
MNQYLALTSPGLESFLVRELETLGASQIKETPAGVYFSASLLEAYQICLWTRYSTRILKKIHEGFFENKGEFIRVIDEVNFPSIMKCHQTFKTDFVGRHKLFENTQYGALLLKDILVDQFSKKYSERPNVERQDADFVFQARVRRNKVQLFLDFSGASLHQRGYRSEQGEAPLKEHLACAMIEASGWLKDTSRPLVDPCCGSGTIMIEAASMACHRAPGLKRYFAFENHNDFDASGLKVLVDEAQAKETSPDLTIIGCDINRRVVDKARKNAKNAGFGKVLKIDQGSAEEFDWTQFDTPGVVVTNPPYGERMGEFLPLVNLYARWMYQLKTNGLGWHVSLLTSDELFTAKAKVAVKKRNKVRNGPIDCEIMQIIFDERQCEIKKGDQGKFQLNDENSLSFFKRLEKNTKKLKKWLKQENIDCYRLYDADIPEYNFAVDVYGEHLVIQEYAPPKTVDAIAASKRKFDALLLLSEFWQEPEKILYKVREKQKGKNQYNALEKKTQYVSVQEYNARFLVNLTDYLDNGLFLDHRITRAMLGRMSKDKHVLNLFCYTGTASVHAALGGAKSVTSVDMSRTYLNWAKDNFAENELFNWKKYRFEQDNCIEWVQSCTQKFDLVFLDPPTFSNSKRMKDVFDVQRDHVLMLEDIKDCLNEGGKVIFSNNHRKFKLDQQAIEDLGFQVTDITKKTIPLDFERNQKIHHCWLLELAE